LQHTERPTTNGGSFFFSDFALTSASDIHNILQLNYVNMSKKVLKITGDHLVERPHKIAEIAQDELASLSLGF